MPNTAFYAETVSLQQSNLIEASAGTGKTYSIALLSLRLLLEKNIPIQEILMVTFTKAAVAELEMRVREFIRLAHNASLGKAISDPTIAAIVGNSIEALGEKETQRILYQAILFLDETGILTIHSFCQRTLTEYAFETNQIFGAEAMSPGDLDDLSNDEVNFFWRKYIVVVETKLLDYLIPKFLSRDILFKYIREAMSGKKLIVLSPYPPDLLSTQRQNELIKALNEQQEIINNADDLALAFILNNLDTLYKATESNKLAKKALIALFDYPGLLLKAVWENLSKDYVKKVFADLLPIIKPAEIAGNLINKICHEFTNQLYQMAIDVICRRIANRKQSSSLLAFDDMIRLLHQAVVINQNETLASALRQKYKAVFIDEFQDTDKLQYEIFNALFGTDTILFYIGDPKQSIYAWRQADINTYFKAGNAVTNRYGMNINYRSCNGIINAQNDFFNPTDDFDTFSFGAAPDAIHYYNVDAPANNKKGNLLFNGNRVTPITIYNNQNNDEIVKAVVATVIQLLSNAAYTIGEKNTAKPIRPSDIGILVRTNKKGKEIKEKLSLHKIPAVTIDDTKLSETKESAELQYILQAVVEINAANINKALLSGLTGFTIENISQLNEELVLQQFKTYQQSWTKEGVYVMLMKFITDYQVKSHLLEGDIDGGERILSNTLQLVELLHKIQTNKQYSPTELINWLQKLREGHTAEGDEFEQRMESDEDAVKIITIHKSKGLEYNIVIAPSLDSKSDISDFPSYRDPVTGDYLFANKAILTPDQIETILIQQEQENRRLIYVAITRAKYKCFIYNSLANYYKKSSLKPFIESIAKSATTEISFEDAPEIPFRFKYNTGVQHYPIAYKKATSFSLEQLHWHKMSYTFLNPEHAALQKPTAALAMDPYSEFVFTTLKKGAYTGNLLHYIFEFIHFSDNTNWPKLVNNALKRLSPGNQVAYATNLLELLRQVTETELHCNGQPFSLSHINPENRINEFEFDFVVQPFQVAQINQLSTSKIPFYLKPFHRSSGQLEGIMNGKMDLFFEQGGKYYILDWKSNYLGDRLEDYTVDKVWDAMAENNYHLQYHIYTVAICKYLALHVPGFCYETHFGGVIYLFVRGMRKGETTGIFFHQPEKNTIDQLTRYVSNPVVSEPFGN